MGRRGDKSIRLFNLQKSKRVGQKKRDMQHKVRVTQISFMLLFVMFNGLRELGHILLHRAVFILVCIQHHAMGDRETYGDEEYEVNEFFHKSIIPQLLLLKLLFSLIGNHYAQHREIIAHDVLGVA